MIHRWFHDLLGVDIEPVHVDGGLLNLTLLAFLLLSSRLRLRRRSRCRHLNIPPSHFPHLPLASFDFCPGLERKHDVPHLLLELLHPQRKRLTLRLALFGALLRRLEVLQQPVAHRALLPQLLLERARELGNPLRFLLHALLVVEHRRIALVLLAPPPRLLGRRRRARRLGVPPELRHDVFEARKLGLQRDGLFLVKGALRVELRGEEVRVFDPYRLDFLGGERVRRAGPPRAAVVDGAHRRGGQLNQLAVRSVLDEPVHVAVAGVVPHSLGLELQSI